MPILIAHAAATSDGSAGSFATTGAIDTTGSNLIVINIGTYGGLSAGVPTDSKSNTWTGLTGKGGSYGSRFFYCYNPTVGSGHTFTISIGLAPPFYPCIFVAAFSDSLSSPFDQENGATGGSGTTLNTGSITPSQANEIIVTGFCFNTSSAIAISLGLTISDQKPAVPFSTGGAMAYLFQGSAAAINPQWSWTGSDASAAVIASFKAAVSSTVKQLAALGVG